MFALIATFVTAAGAALGSFMAVLVIRSERHVSVIGGRSACDVCQRPLAVWELVPVFSFIALNGRCRSCKAPIDRLHPYAELAGAAIALSAVLVMPAADLTSALWFGWTLCLLALFDSRTGMLPLPLTAALALSGLANAAWTTGTWPIHAASGLLMGAVALGALAWGYRFLRGRYGLGGGDILLAAGLGAWLGPYALPYALLGSALLGIAFVGIRSTLTLTPLSATESIAFGPFLAIAGWAAYLGVRAI